MKKLITLIVMLFAAVILFAQDNNSNKKIIDEYKPRFGIKAGYNWSYVTASNNGLSRDGKPGFMAAVFFSPASHNGLGYRTELVFSRQGYTFDDGGKNTSVMNDYIYMPHLTTFTIGKVVQVQAGMQIGFLLNSKLSGNKDSSITGIMNRFDYGFATGIEFYPVKGLIIGGRYNLGLGKLTKQYELATNKPPYPLPFDPNKTNLKNGLLQLFVGYKL
jgi:hypothetical protein